MNLTNLLDDLAISSYLFGSLRYFMNETGTGLTNILHTLFLFGIKSFPEAALSSALKVMKKRGEKDAVIWSGGKRTYYEIFERTMILADFLIDSGVRPGDKLAFMSINIPQAPEIWYVCNILGISLIPVNWRLVAEEIKYIVEHSGAKIMIYNREKENEIKKAGVDFKVSVSVDEGFENEYENIIYEWRKKINGNDIEKRIEKLSEILSRKLSSFTKRKEKKEGGIIIYTSGTTGKPKGAMRKAQPLLLILLISSAAREFGLTKDNVHLVVSPLYHSAPFFFSQLTLGLGGTLVILPRFRVEPFFEFAHRFRTTSTFIVPFMLYEILENHELLKKYDLSSFTHFICGAAPLSPEKKKEFVRKMGYKLYEFYGSTETSINSILRPQDVEKKAESVGKIVPFCRVKIVNEDGKVCGPNEEGLIYIRTPFMMKGYYKDEKATYEVSYDGYITAGDIGKIDEEGFLYVLDRKKDMIISAGVNIYPAEIENALLQHPAVKMAAVVGVPDEKWGEKVKAFVVLKEKVDVKELEKFLREKIAGYKIPREWEFVDSLPMTPSGKILKRELVKSETYQKYPEKQ